MVRIIVFIIGPVLCKIANGVNAHPAVNVEDAKIFEDDIVQKMVGQKVVSFISNVKIKPSH